MTYLKAQSKVGVQRETKQGGGALGKGLRGADDACSALWRVGRMSIDGRDIRLEVCFCRKELATRTKAEWCNCRRVYDVRYAGVRFYS